MSECGPGRDGLGRVCRGEQRHECGIVVTGTVEVKSELTCPIGASQAVGGLLLENLGEPAVQPISLRGRRSAYTTSPRSGCRNRYTSWSTISSRASITVRNAASSSLVGLSDDRLEQVVGGVTTDRCHGLQHAASVVVESGDLGGDQIGEHDRNRFAGEVSGDELSGEERIALAAGDDLVDEVGRVQARRAARNRCRDLVAIQPLQLDPMCSREAAQLRQSAAL